MSIDRHEVGARLSQAVKHGDTIYLAGQVDDSTPSVKGQAEAVLKKIDAILKHYGSHKSKLLSATVYVASMALYNDMNAAWDAWVDKANPPARATVETKLARPQFKVEIMAIASV